MKHVRDARRPPAGAQGSAFGGAERAAGARNAAVMAAVRSQAQTLLEKDGNSRLDAAVAVESSRGVGGQPSLLKISARYREVQHLPGGNVRSFSGRWIPSMPSCRAPAKKPRLAPPLTTPLYPSMHRAYDAKRDGPGPTYRLLSQREARCPKASRWPSAAETPRTTCAEAMRRSSNLSAVRMLLGVHSASELRRNAIRETWMRWGAVGHSLVVCFIIGAAGVPKAERAKLEEEVAPSPLRVHCPRPRRPT